MRTAASSRPAGGLVEDQQLGRRIERVREQHAPQLAARQHRERPPLEPGAGRRARAAARSRAASPR